MENKRRVEYNAVSSEPLWSTDLPQTSIFIVGPLLQSGIDVSAVTLITVVPSFSMIVTN
jgi:hypothetical protein